MMMAFPHACFWERMMAPQPQMFLLNFTVSSGVCWEQFVKRHVFQSVKSSACGMNE